MKSPEGVEMSKEKAKGMLVFIISSAQHLLCVFCTIYRYMAIFKVVSERHCFPWKTGNLIKQKLM